METTIEGRDGWIEVVHGGVHVLTKGDDDLRERLQAALADAGDESPADVVTDELTTGGVRRTPDFAVVDESEGRVLVRGSASVLLTSADGTSREVVAPARGPWADEDLDDGLETAVLATGEGPEPAEDAAEPRAPQDAPAVPAGWAVPSIFGGAKSSSGAPADEARPALSVVSEPTREPSGQPEPREPVSADVADAADEPATPVEEAPVIETPAPQGQDIAEAEDEAAPAAEGPAAPAAEGGDEDDELPSFDFLFGNTNHHRSSLLSGLEGEEGPADDAEESIDSGPVAAAGGFQAPEDQANATLAPPHDEEHEEVREPAAGEPGGPPISSVPGGLPPMPGSTAAEDPDPAGPSASPDADAAIGSESAQDRFADPSAPSGASQEVDPAPTEDGPGSPVAAPAGPVRVQAARDDATGREPGAVRPQFADGHLVGSRVPAAAAAGTAGPAAVDPPAAQDGMISAVPWGEGAPAQGGPPPGTPGGVPGLPAGLPGLPTPDHGPAQPAQPTPDFGSAQQVPGQEPEADTGELPSGPMVLAVRCASGHRNAPHATRCRVCGQDLPTQQPEQTPRPALGLLRLSTGDVVTLDRGVLIGRAPRASAEASGARVPHLVRIASPDNEISRNHVEIVLDGWHVLVRDLGSTNGTTVALPGSSPVRVRPGDQQTIEPGTTITLADQVSMVFEVTG